MARDARAGERVYEALKADILSGAWRLRQRLDIEMLAKRLGVSATPVRVALAVLTRERLVTLKGARGYHVAFWSERELADLYAWRAMLAERAFQTYQAREPVALVLETLDHGAAFKALMGELEAHANLELRYAACAVDERLAAALKAEPAALGDAQRELGALAHAVRQHSRGAGPRLARYFARRVHAAGAIRRAAHAAAMPSNGD